MTTTQVIDPGAGWEVLHQVRTVVDAGLRAAVDRLSEPVRTVAGYHFGWCDEHGSPTDTGAGKAIRPALALLCAQAVGGTPERGVDAAVAVELAHNFSLIHDDIMDGDATRRHRPTVWSVFGVPTAILAGDALLVLAVEVLAAHPSTATAGAVGALCGALRDLVAGQSADMSFEHRRDVSIEECVAMATGKTAALLGCACALGALVAGARASRLEQSRRFGHHLGLAFQLIDDLLGIWGDPQTTGKPVYSDLRSAKKSLPVVAALTADTDASRHLARVYGRPTPMDEAELEAAASLIEQAGGRTWAQAEADRHLHAALSCLDAMHPDPTAAAGLLALARLITRRNH